MVRAGYYGDGTVYRIVLSGHAGYADYGDDIVCSAISILIFALDRFLGEEEDVACRSELDNDAERDVFVEARLGDASPVSSRERVDAAFDVMLDGLRMIAEQYPDCLVLREMHGH